MLTGNALTTLHSRLSIKKQLLKCSSHLYAAGGYGGGGRGLCGFVVLVREETRRNDRRGKQAFIYMHKHTNAKKKKGGKRADYI